MISTAFLRCVKWGEGSGNVDDGVIVKIKADVAFFWGFYLGVCGLKSVLMRGITTASFLRVQLTKASLCAAL